MRRTVGGAVTNATMRIAPAQAGQSETSISNTRRSNWAQRRRRARSAGQSSDGATGEAGAGRCGDSRRALGHHAAAPPPQPPPRGIGAVVAHARLVGIGHVVGPAGEELERAQAVDADVGAGGGIGNEFDLGALAVIAQAVLGDRGAGAVAGDAHEALAIVAGDRGADVGAEARMRPGEHGGGGVPFEPVLAREPGEHGAAERFLEDGGVVRGGGEEPAVARERAVGDQHVQVGCQWASSRRSARRRSRRGRRRAR